MKTSRFLKPREDATGKTSSAEEAFDSMTFPLIDDGIGLVSSPVLG
jgi:hypothetical protein